MVRVMISLIDGDHRGSDNVVDMVGLCHSHFM